MSDHKRNPRALHFTPAGGGAAPAQIRDALGRVLSLGDEVLAMTPACLMRIASVRPILHPGAPPNLVEVVLVTRMQMAVPRDQGVENLYLLRHQAEIGDGMIPTGPEAESPDGEPPIGDESGPAEKPALISLD